MLEAARAALARMRDSDGREVAPYAERARPKPGKWDRPLDRLSGAWLARSGLARRVLEQRAIRVEALDGELRALGSEAFEARRDAMRAKLLRAGPTPDLAVEAFAMVREATGRVLGIRHHRVQLMGGFAMLDGCLAEMATGEGKTITALLPAVAAGLAGIPVHVFTVNDYLAERDAAKLKPIYEMLGLSVGLIIHDVQNHERRAAYNCDVVYGTNKEIAFDYLRDRTALKGARGAGRRRVAELFGAAGETLLLRGLHFAVVDEADSIFIDEARTPLILSVERDPGDGGALYAAALDIADQLEDGPDYRVDEGDRAVLLSDRGKENVTALASGLPGTMWRSRRAREELVGQALSARRLYRRDRDYIVVDGKVQIVDESTGRVMADRSWERGLHQLIETIEGVEISGAKETLARVTYQRFFRRYLRIAGMSGTVSEVADELWADYGIRVTRIPTHRPGKRVDRGHRLCRDQESKWALVVRTVQRVQAEEGRRPMLLGTRSVGASEALSAALTSAGVPHVVLNARQDADEAAIIGAAGHLGAVTVATNMAGRGTDVELEPDAKLAGGLHVILTEFHETSRVDRQLYGRAGRQGDPGSCEAITALDDDLYRNFAPAAAVALASANPSWPISGSRADLLRRLAQAAANRKAASARRQTELMEERLDKSIAFAGSN